MSYTILGENQVFSISHDHAIREINIAIDEQSTEIYTVILEDPSVPKRGDAHPVYPYLHAEKITLTPSEKDALNTLRMIIEYSANAPSVTFPVPWMEKPIVRTSGINQRKLSYSYFDINGDEHPNTNSAGENLNAVETLSALLRFEITINYPQAFLPSRYDALLGTINKNSMSILGRSGTACFYMEDIQCETRTHIIPERNEVIPYYAVTYVIQYTPNSFALQQWDEGLRELVDGQLKEVEWNSAEGEKVQPLKPVKLNGLGAALSDSAQHTPGQWVNVSGPRYFIKPATWNIVKLPTTEAF